MGVPLLETVPAFWQCCPAGRLACLDVGSKTIGIALSDAMRIIASPFKTLPRKKWTQDGPLLVEVLKAHDVVGLVVGWPLLLDGGVGPRCHATRHFVVNLMGLWDCPVVFWDERLSTVAATRILRDEADLSRSRRSRSIDSVAASLILESILRTQARDF